VLLTLTALLIPFAVLPIFLSLERIPRNLLEASADLGASNLQSFRRVVLPLSLPAFLLAKEGRHLVVAACLAGLAAFAYFAFWFEILAELGIQKAPWS